jgi:DNA-directed RNA polymerase beta subunit
LVRRINNDIPNVSEEATKDLDENGMIRIGAEVKPGDILLVKLLQKENLIQLQKKNFFEQSLVIKLVM